MILQQIKIVIAIPASRRR